MSFRIGWREHDCAKAARTVSFGEGKLIVGRGKIDGKASVHIEPAPHAGTVGDNVPDNLAPPRDYLVPYEVVLVFPTEEQAARVAAALVNDK